MLSSTAQRVLAQGCSVVLDAAYLQEAERTEIAASRSHLRHSLRRPVPHRRSRDAAGADRAAQGRCVRCNTECRPEAGDFRDRRGRLAYNRCLGDAGPVAPQRPYFLVCGAGRALTMRAHPTGTSSRRKAAEAAGLDCAAAFQKMALDCVARYQGPSRGRVRRRCRGRASDPGRDHAVARRRGVLRADRGRCGMAAPEAGNRLAERPARRRARQRCRRGICAPQAIPRMGAGHDRRAARTAPGAGSSPPGALPAFRPDATPDRGHGTLDQTGSVAEALQAAQGRGSLCNPIARANSTAGTNGWSARANA